MSESELSNYIFDIVRIGSFYESNTNLMFSKDFNNNYIIIFKYITTSIKMNILDIEDISVGNDGLLWIKFRSEKKMDLEKFRSKENEAIIKIFKKMKEKAMQVLDETIDSNSSKNSAKLKKNIQRNLLDLF